MTNELRDLFTAKQEIILKIFGEYNNIKKQLKNDELKIWIQRVYNFINLNLLNDSLQDFIKHNNETQNIKFEQISHHQFKIKDSTNGIYFQIVRPKDKWQIQISAYEIDNQLKSGIEQFLKGKKFAGQNKKCPNHYKCILSDIAIDKFLKKDTLYFKELSNGFLSITQGYIDLLKQ